MNLSRRKFLWAAAAALAGCTAERERQTQPQAVAVQEAPPKGERPTRIEGPIRVQPLGREHFLSRIERARRLMAEKRISALILTPGSNLHYLSAIRIAPSERLVALVLPRQGRGEPVLICPSFEEDRIRRQAFVSEIRGWREEEDPYVLLARTMREVRARLGTIAVEPTASFDTYLNLRRALPGARLVSAAGILEPLRIIKSPEEVELIEAAVKGTERVIEALFLTLYPGITERELANDISSEMRRLGEGGGGIVQFGPSSALPHAAPGDRRLAVGQVVLVDIGMRIEGYVSDITRTAVYKRPNPVLEKIFNIVLSAQRAGIQAARPGATCESVDLAARKVIEDAGYGDYFTHRLGHGLGLDGHEKPYLVRGNKTELQPGMTLTIEPGIYVPGEFGVRIEDDVVITEEGCRLLSSQQTSLRVL